MFKIKIPCYFNNNETIVYENIIGDCPAAMCDVRDVTIYSMPIFIGGYYEDGKELGTRIILPCNESLITPLKINEVEYLIENKFK